MTRILPMTLYFKDPSYHDEDGNLYPGQMEPIDGRWCTDISACDHTRTACFDCLDTWSEDYIGFVHLPDGRGMRLDDISRVKAVPALLRLYKIVQRMFGT